MKTASNRTFRTFFGQMDEEGGWPIDEQGLCDGCDFSSLFRRYTRMYARARA